MSIFTKLFGDSSQKTIKSFQLAVEKINAQESDLQKLSADQLRGKTSEFKERLGKGEALDDLLSEAFALVREAARRTLNQRHFDVQLIGGMALHQGRVAEMRTGEGKTLSATLPAYLNALEGKGVHVVTVNEYLAERDAIWMGQIYAALGLTTGCITSGASYLYDASYNNVGKDQLRDAGFLEKEYLKPVAKKQAYDADITYGTNNEFGFDYLRDNMILDASQQAQRGHHYAIVDEVDSILIDQARVPLIISGQPEEVTDKYQQFAKLVAPLIKDTDYTIDEKFKAVSFTEEGQNKVVKSLGSDPWQENDITAAHQLEVALKAKTLFKLDRDYIIKNKEVMIVDEFTGRILQGRRWSGGLHQAVEAKEGVPVQPESIILGTVTFQNYFRLYKKVSGMTGTALTSAEELDKVYALDVVVIPTHRPMLRQDFPDKIFKTKDGRLKAVVAEIKRLNASGQPLLIVNGGITTGNEFNPGAIASNMVLKEMLDKEGIKSVVLNGKITEAEGEAPLIAQAGKIGAVTLTSNMAGRGVDIILGGNLPNPDPDQKEAQIKAAQKVRELGGLYVVGIERNGSRRVDNQSIGRAGRQGDPGASQFFVSAEDDLMRTFGGDKVKSLMNALKVPDDEPIQSKMLSNTLESAQAKVEGFEFDARNHVLEYDDVMNKHREIIYKKRREFLQIVSQEQVFDFEKYGITQADYDKKEAEVGRENMGQLVRFVSLKVIDMFWQEHLSNMEQMRDSVKLRAYGGKDPLIEYKNEGRRLFAQMLEQIDYAIGNNILNARMTNAPQTRAPLPVGSMAEPEVGRNDFCPCGSGKKFKKCGALNTLEHQTNMSKKS